MRWIEVPCAKVPKLKQLCDVKYFPILKNHLMAPETSGSYAFARDEEGNIWFINQCYPDEFKYYKMEI